MVEIILKLLVVAGIMLGCLFVMAAFIIANAADRDERDK
jgi:hypothetical protein